MQLSWGRTCGWAGGECHGQCRSVPTGLGRSPGMNPVVLSVCTGCVPQLQGAPFRHAPVWELGAPWNHSHGGPAANHQEKCVGSIIFFEEPFIPVVITESVGLCWWVLVLTLPLSLLKRVHLFICYNQTSSIAPGIMDHKLLHFPNL